MDLRVLVSLKMTCTLVCQKIILNSSLRPGTYGTEKKIFLLAPKPVSGFTVVVVGSFSKSSMVVDFKKNSMEVVHFFNQGFRKGTNIFGFKNQGLDDCFFWAEIGWLEFQPM